MPQLCLKLQHKQGIRALNFFTWDCSGSLWECTFTFNKSTFCLLLLCILPSYLFDSPTTWKTLINERCSEHPNGNSVTQRIQFYSFTFGYLVILFGQHLWKRPHFPHFQDHLKKIFWWHCDLNSESYLARQAYHLRHSTSPFL
jgi:hypothetical protein